MHSQVLRASVYFLFLNTMQLQVSYASGTHELVNQHIMTNEWWIVWIPPSLEIATLELQREQAVKLSNPRPAWKTWIIYLSTLSSWVRDYPMEKVGPLYHMILAGDSPKGSNLSPTIMDLVSLQPLSELKNQVHRLETAPLELHCGPRAKALPI